MGEKINVEAYAMSEEQLMKVKKIPHINNVEYHENLLSVSTKSGKSCLLELMNILKDENIVYGKIYSEMPTLNDVFLEITGKALRD